MPDQAVPNRLPERGIASDSLLSSSGWTLIIQPRRGWWDLRLPQLWTYRDLVILFVRRDFVAQYKQTILGPLWYILQPILTTVVFTVVFGNIAKLPTDGIPPFLFYLSGTVFWQYFAECLNKTSQTFSANAQLFGKAYFPRLAVPVSILISNLATFVVQFTVFLVFLFYFMATGADVHPTVAVLLTPVLLIMMALLGLGFGIIVSSLTTRYRDLRFLVTFGVQLWMYGTPVIYPMSAVPDDLRFLIMINPVTPIFETFREAFLGAGTLSLGHLLYSAGFTASVLVLGIVLFNRVEQTFMDTV